MTDIITTVTGTIALARKAIDANEAMKTADFKMLMADLMSDLADLKIKCSDLEDENHSLKRELRKREETVTIQMKLKGDVYYSEDDGPFCTTCWDKDDKKIRVKADHADFQSIFGSKYVCPVCQTRHKGEAG